MTRTGVEADRRAALADAFLERRDSTHPANPLGDHRGVGTSVNWARIAARDASTAEPIDLRSYFGDPSEASAARTVLQIPNGRGGQLIGNPSGRCRLRISDTPIPVRLHIGTADGRPFRIVHGTVLRTAAGAA